MVIITDELKELARIFYENGEKLYIVGGYVRDGYLNIENKMEKKDIDLCSSAVPEKVEYILKNTKFKVKYLSRELGVLVILGEERYEYATFRREFYSDNKHTPDSVVFIKSIREDSERRDLKINAIYYDIFDEEFVDPLGGLKDLDKKVVTTTRIPRIVFSDDPERILRFIRFSQSLNLTIPDEEYHYLKENALKIQYLSRGRIRKEFIRILYSDQIYEGIEGIKESHYKSILMMEDLGILQIIFPLLSSILKSDEKLPDGTKLSECVLNHLKVSSKELRLPIIFFDSLNNEILKHENSLDKKENKKNIFDKEKYLSDVLKKNIGEEGLNFPKEEIDKIKKIVLGYYYKKTIFTNPKDIRRFIFDNYEAFDGIIELKKLIVSKENEKENEKRLKLIKLLEDTYKRMREDNTLFDYTKLNTTGKELIKYFPKIKLNLLDEFMFEIAGELSKNTGMENNIENIVDMGKIVLSEKLEYFCEDEFEVATYKKEGKVKTLIKKFFRKIKKFLKLIFEKIYCMFLNLSGKDDPANQKIKVKKKNTDKKKKSKEEDTDDLFDGIDENLVVEDNSVETEEVNTEEISESIDDIDTEEVEEINQEVDLEQDTEDIEKNV